MKCLLSVDGKADWSAYYLAFETDVYKASGNMIISL